jgi:hypothetical protein
MEVVAASAIVSFLVGYARHVAGGVADEAVRGWLQSLWNAVRERFAAEPQASGALLRMAEQPDNPRRQAAVEDHLDDLLASDSEFAAVLRQLMSQRPDLPSSVEVRDAGAVAFGGNVSISGGSVAAGRDVRQRNLK